MTTNAPFIQIKKLIWLYFILVLFEGALRKWFLPALAGPLLIVRDPIALYAIYIALSYKIFPSNHYIFASLFLSSISILSALALGHGNIYVALYGARVYMLHFPFMFLIGLVFNRQDVLQIVKFILIISIPMVTLIALQFYSPQSAWVNRGVGGSLEGAGFSGAQGYFRPPGTFSFTNGNVLYFSMLASFVFYSWFGPIRINRILLITSSLALMASIPLSISRALVLQIIICVLFVVISISGNIKLFSKLLAVIMFVFVAILLLSNISFVQTALGAFLERFSTANEHEGGIEGVFMDRILGGLIKGISDSGHLPFWGFGIGMGTNAGAQMLMGSVTFLVAEEEWGRIVGEMGFMIGLLMIFLRVHLSFKLLLESFSRIRENDILPWMLMSFCFMLLIQGQWGQPTILGFSTFTGGLLLSTLRTNELNKDGV